MEDFRISYVRITKKFLPISPLIFYLIASKHIGLVYAHTGGATTDTNQNFVLLLFLGFLISLLPFLLGVLIYFPIDNNDLFRSHKVKFQGLATGILLFLFYDYLTLSSFLGIRSPSLINQFLILVTFIVTILVFTKLEPLTIDRKVTLSYLWAVGIGIHSFAEGIIMGFNFHLGVSSILLPFPALSFIMHKFAEGTTLAILLLNTNPKNNSMFDNTKLEAQIVDQTERMKILFLVVISVLPTFFGIILGYFDDIVNMPYLTTRLQTFLYTSSLGAVLFIFPNFLPSHINLESKTKHLYLFWVIVGFLFLLIGVYFHEI